MERERLTITLKKDILKLVDQSIDGAKLRNRSHAIEYFLSRELSPKSVKVVLALPGSSPGRRSYQTGGMQVGFRESMNEGQNIREILQNLSMQGFKDIVLLGQQSTALQATAVDAENMELNVKVQNTDTGSEYALSDLEQSMKDETFIYWDTRYTSGVNLSDFLDFHKTSQAQATAAVSTHIDQGSFVDLSGVVYGKRVTGITGKDTTAHGLPMVGIFAFEPQVMNMAGGKSIYRDILPQLATEGKLSAFVFTPTENVRETAAMRR